MYTFTYHKTTPESAENSDHGFIVDGFEFSMLNEETLQDVLENFSDYETVDSLEGIVRSAQSLGITFYNGSWFESVTPEIDYKTGEYIFYALHVKASQASRQRIAKLL